MFLPSCSVSVKAVYSSFAIWNRAHGHLLISLHPTCFRVQPRLNAERSQYKWRFQSIYLSVQPRLNARDRCKSDFILSVDIFREARRGLSDKYLLRSQRVSPIIYWAKIIQYNPHSISTKPFLSPLIFYWAIFSNQTTTQVKKAWREQCCHISTFYIKPQHRRNHGRRKPSCHIFTFYIKPQLIMMIFLF